MTGRADDLDPNPTLRRWFEQQEQGQGIFVGWPLVVFQDRRGQRQIAPLFLTEIEAPDTPEGRVVATDEEPYLNNAVLLGGEFFSVESVAKAESYLPWSGLLPFTDPAALVTLARRILQALGFDRTDLDVDRLDHQRPREVGVYNSSVAVRGNKPTATSGLLKELSQLRARDDWEPTAVRWLFRPAPANRELGGTPLSPKPLFPLSDAQQQAAATAATADVTAVTGPPGTGKSELVATIVADAWGRGESVLVASTNNGAVEVAATRCQKVDAGLLVRTGNQEVREVLPAALEELAARVPEPSPSPEITSRRLRAADTRRSAQLDAIAERARLDEALIRAALDREELARVLWDQPQPPPGVTGQHARILRRVERLQIAPWLFPRWRLRRLRDALFATHDQVNAEDVKAWATKELQFETWREEHDALGPDEPEVTYAQLIAVGEEWSEASRAALVPKVHESLRAAATAMRQLAHTRPGDRGARVAAVEKALAAGARGWACTAKSVHSNFPLRAGLFDLVVVDEASQTGVADLIPLAYRARRLVVIGDPQQLTPVVSFEEPQLRALAATSGLSHTKLQANGLSAADSAFSAATVFAPDGGQLAPLLLDEHRRCHPQIAAFCNEHFYGGDLRVLTDTSEIDEEPRGLNLVPVVGTMRRGPQGTSWVNDAEVESAVDWLIAHHDSVGSLGVVTPYKAQRQAITDELVRRAGKDAAGAVEVGTVHTFQGGERDVMVFSPVLARGAGEGTVKWIEDHRHLVNVAASRARRALIVVTDPVAVAELDTPTLNALLATAARFGAAGAPAAPVHPAPAEEQSRLLHSRSESALDTALRARGLSVDLKPVVRGYELDFALRTPAGPVDVECDGVHHMDARGRQRRQDLARDAILRRAGWRVLRYPSWRCLTEPDRVVDDIIAAIAGAASAAVIDHG